MEEVLYMHLINTNQYVSKCCMCGVVTGFKDAGKELHVGDPVLSHTYCIECAERLATPGVLSA